MNQLSHSLNEFLRKTDLSVFETILEDAYLKGYYDRIVAEKIINKNPVIPIGNRNWYKFNYGATWQEDREMGAHASGKCLSWNEANIIPYCKLPSKEDVEVLLEYSSMDIEYNVGRDHKPWNSRVVLSDDHNMISFYEWGNCYPDKSYVKGRHIVQCWLSDEVDDKTALSVVFLITCENKEKVGDYKGKLIGIEYIPVSKEETMQTHFIESDHIPAYEDFAKFYLGD